MKLQFFKTEEPTATCTFRRFLKGPNRFIQSSRGVGIIGGTTLNNFSQPKSFARNTVFRILGIFRHQHFHSIHSDMFKNSCFWTLKQHVFHRFQVFCFGYQRPDLQCPHWHARCCSFAQLPWAKVPTKKSPEIRIPGVSIGIMPQWCWTLGICFASTHGWCRILILHQKIK